MNTRRRQNVRNHLVILRRVSTGVFLSLLIPLVLLGVVYGRMNAKIREQYYERSIANMTSSLHGMELLFDNLDQIAVYLGDNYEVTDYFNIDRTEIRTNLTAFLKAQQVVSSISIANSDVANIQLYSARSGTLIDFDTVSLYPERYYGHDFWMEEYDCNRFRAEYLQDDRFLGCSRQIVTGTRYNGSEPTLIYQRRLISSHMTSRNNRILFSLSESHLLDLFRSLDDYEDSSLFLLNEQGDILLQHEGTAVRENILPLLQQAGSSDGITGYFNVKTDGMNASVTCCRSEKRGWLCVAVLPYQMILSATNTFRTSMLILLIIAVLAGVSLLILHGVRLATPAFEVADVLRDGTEKADFTQIAGKVRELARNNEQLQETIDRQVSAVKAEAFLQLLTGEDLSDAEKLDALDGIGIPKNADYYMILLFNANDTRIDADLEVYGMQRVLLENLLKEQNTLEMSEFFPMDMERSVLCLTADGLSRAEFQRRAEEMVSRVRQSLEIAGEISYSVGGDIVDSAARLSRAFLHAQLALKIPQNIFGTHVIQWYERAKQFTDLGNVSSGDSEDAVSPQNRILIENIKKYIQDHYSNPQLSLSLVGEEFYITEVYLSKLFKKATGENFSRYVEGIRMKRAKELLDEGHKVSEVVQLVGYNSPQVFRRAWKRYYKEEEETGETKDSSPAE